MTIFGWVILILLAIIVLLLTVSLFIIIKKASYFSKKDRDLIIFIIDMYVDYGQEIGITSKDKHDTIVSELNKIKEKLK